VSYVTLILTVIGGILSLLTTGSVSAVNTLKKENDGLKTENADLKAKVAASDQKLKLSVDEATSREELIIADLKKKLADAEADLAKASTPAAVRDRLSVLFP
jgi:hypothetical protein